MKPALQSNCADQSEAGTIVDGPFEKIPYALDKSVDLYLLRFDRSGNLLSPASLEALLKTVGDYTDVFMFSHGWNNIFSVAVERYKQFAAKYIDQRKKLNLKLPDPYRPVLVGVIWPSTSLVMPWETGPQIAAAGDSTAGRIQEEMLQMVLHELDDQRGAILAEFVDAGEVTDKRDAETLAGIIRAALIPPDEPDIGTAPTSDEIIASWAALDELGGGKPAIVRKPGDFSTISDDQQPAPDLSAAGGFSLDPRNLLRMATVWTMKGRAGVVGAAGVGPVLCQILTNSQARVHMVGHSFGARVVLSAIASEPGPSRKVHAVLLLQPAINRWCFADSVTPLAKKNQAGQPGGYHVILDRVERPIFTTYSDADEPLSKAFHLAVRGNIGEVNIAAVFDELKYRCGALGGYPPEGIASGLDTRNACEPGVDGYDTDDDCRVLAIFGGHHDGQTLIKGHGDVVTDVTAWMLHTLTR